MSKKRAKARKGRAFGKRSAVWFTLSGLYVHSFSLTLSDASKLTRKSSLVFPSGLGQLINS